MNNSKKPYIYLNAFLVKEEFKTKSFESFLKDVTHVTPYSIKNIHEVDGIIYIKKQVTSPQNGSSLQINWLRKT